jgi:hypothetical protein
MTLRMNRPDAIPFPTEADWSARRDPTELLRWARFLDQGDAWSVSRRRSVEALLEAAAQDDGVLRAALAEATMAMSDGDCAHGVIELLEDALHEIAGTVAA